MDRKEKLYKNFKRLYESTGLSQSKFAKLTGILQIQVNKILRKKYSITDLSIDRIISSMGININSDNLNLEKVSEAVTKFKKIQPTKERISVEYKERVRDNFIKLYKNSNLTGIKFGENLNTHERSIFNIVNKQDYVSRRIFDMVKKVYNLDLYSAEIQNIEHNDNDTQVKLLKDLYKQTGLSQAQFSKILDVNYSLISRVFSGERVVSKKLLQKVLKIYNLDLSKAEVVIYSKSIEQGESAVKRDFLNLYKSTACTKKQFAKMAGIKVDTLNQILKPDKSISTRAKNKIEKNMNVKLGAPDSTDLVSDDSVVGFIEPTYMIIAENSAPVVLPTLELIRERAQYFRDNDIKFSVFRETLL